MMISTTGGTSVNAGGASALKPEEIEMAKARLRAEQNLPLGLLFGAVAALAGAGLWAAVTALTSFQIGWMAVGVGFLVGLGVRQGGRGIDPVFGVAGAALSLAGCVAGNLLVGCIFVASNEGVTLLQVLAALDAGFATRLLTATAGPIDLLFYGIAVYEGYRLSMRPLTPAEVQRVLGRAGEAPTAA